MATESKRPKLTQQTADFKLLTNQTVRTVIEPSLFTRAILPFVLCPKDRLNCMLVCKEWHRQLSTCPSAWRHIEKLRVTGNADNKSIIHIDTDKPRTLTLRLLSTSKSVSKPDENVRCALQLMCRYVKTIKFVFDKDDTAFTSDGAKMFFDWLNDCTLQLPNVDFVMYCSSEGDKDRDAGLQIRDIEEQLSQFDRLLQTALRSHGQKIGIKFSGPHSNSDVSEPNTDDYQAFKTFLTHHGHKLTVFKNVRVPVGRGEAWKINTIFLSICTKPEHMPVRLQKVRLHAGNDNDKPMAMDLLNKQTAGTLTLLDITQILPDSYQVFLALQPTVVNNLDTLQINFLKPDGALMTDTCMKIAERCPKLFELFVTPFVPCSLTLQQFTTIVRHFIEHAQMEKRLALGMYLYLWVSGLKLDLVSDSNSAFTWYDNLTTDQMRQALVTEFGEQRVRKVGLTDYRPRDESGALNEFFFQIDDFVILLESPIATHDYSRLSAVLELPKLLQALPPGMVILT